MLPVSISSVAAANEEWQLRRSGGAEFHQPSEVAQAQPCLLHQGGGVSGPC